jgi:uncharacterized protein YggL (DUF469 family)
MLRPKLNIKKIIKLSANQIICADTKGHAAQFNRSIKEIMRMKKRLRKKKCLGEFTEWGRQLVITRNRKDGFDEFLDAFIEETIESNGCYCGGGGKEDCRRTNDKARQTA